MLDFRIICLPILYLIVIVIIVLIGREIIPPFVGFGIVIGSVFSLSLIKNKQIDKTLKRYSGYYTIEKGRDNRLSLKINNIHNSYIPERRTSNDRILKKFVYSQLIAEIKKISRDHRLDDIAFRFKRPE